MKSTSPISSAASGLPGSVALSSSSSSCTFSHTPSSVSHSNPAETALREIVCASMSAGRRVGHGVEQTLALLGALPGLDLVPVREHLARRRRRVGVAEDVRMAADDLRADRRDDVVDGELAVVGRDLGVKHDLEKNVAELLSELGDVIGLYRVDGLVGLFHHVLGDGTVRLLAVPRTPVRGPQGGDQLNELVEPVCSRLPLARPRRVSLLVRSLVAGVLPLTGGRPSGPASRISILAFLRRSSRNVWYASRLALLHDDLLDLRLDLGQRSAACRRARRSLG